jgi:hypothetical protein
MAQPVTSPDMPLGEEALLADREHFWHRFTGFTLWTVIFMAVLLSLMAIFLV